MKRSYLIAVISLTAVLATLILSWKMIIIQTQRFHERIDEKLLSYSRVLSNPLWTLDKEVIGHFGVIILEDEIVVGLTIKKEDGELLFSDDQSASLKTSLLSKKIYYENFFVGVLDITFSQESLRKDIKISLILISLVLVGFLILAYWIWHMMTQISIRERIAKELAISKEKAEAANQAKSIFLATMSHELRTPLNAILGFSNILAREQGFSADQKEKLSIISRSGQHLLSMINDVLDISKIETGSDDLKELPFSLHVLLKEVSMMIQQKATKKGIAVAVETEKILFPYIKADLGKLRQILINLLGNAVKFTDEGKITIRCNTESIPEEPNRCLIIIEVEDSGPGIDPASQALIFEPFVQDGDILDRRGTGLGLSISKQFAEFMGGTIKVESELNKGALFRVRIPAQIADSAMIEKSTDDDPRVISLASTEKTFKILVADDKRENLLLLKSVLEEVGFTVIEAKNGSEAVEAFRKESPDFIWMDMRMPVMDGYEATRKIRLCSGGDQIPIVAITASAFREQRPDILEAGCNDMVSKPFQIDEIFEVMGRFLDIEYVYEAVSDSVPERLDGPELTPALLSELSPELLEDLGDACLDLDNEAIADVIERIRVQAPVTAKSLQHLADNFQTGKIRDILGDT